jgi:hypothetical protein
MSRKEQTIVMDVKKTEARNDCAGESPQKFNRPTEVEVCMEGEDIAVSRYKADLC